MLYKEDRRVFLAKEDRTVQRPVVRTEILGTEDLRGDHSVWASDRVREALMKLGKQQVRPVGVGP